MYDKKKYKYAKSFCIYYYILILMPIVFNISNSAYSSDWHEEYEQLDAFINDVVFIYGSSEYIAVAKDNGRQYG